MALENTVDVITYSGEVNHHGYEAICDVLQQKKSANALLVLATPGGDPHYGFRIARALQHEYGKFDALVPRYCKSAGTLILTGASELYLDDRSELGPLDIQIKKGDELIGRNSGLDIFQAVNYLRAQTIGAFKEYLVDLTREHGLSTKVASDIAASLTSNLFTPVSAQIDPIKLAEMQRATEVAIAYGSRLNQKGGNLREGAIVQLVGSYPSHGFVIDRKEAKTLFTRVYRPEGFIAQLSEAMRAPMSANINSSVPTVEITSYGEPKEASNDPAIPSAIGSQESSGNGDKKDLRSYEANRSSETTEPVVAAGNFSRQNRQAAS